MAKSLAPDRTRATIAILAAVVVLLWSTAFSQVAVIVAGGLIGWRIFRGVPALQITALNVPIRRKSAVALLATFAVLLVGLPIANHFSDSAALAMVAGFYRAGSLVFGGGHVILPLLESVVVPQGWVTIEEFVAGYGAAQAVPGPLFTFSAYLGAVKSGSPSGVAGGLLALFSIFLPSFLLVFGALPFWDVLRARPDFQAALRGINAAVVGILLAALYSPVWTSAILTPEDFALGAVLFGLLVFWQRAPWQVVLVGALGGELIARLS
jgi:chromate transporter